MGMPSIQAVNATIARIGLMPYQSSADPVLCDWQYRIRNKSGICA
jgi:hypothetical protein